MLHFFRKYQKFFFVVITAVIVVSFSFFGTYNAFTHNESDDPIAFTAIDGRPVPLREVQAFERFLNTDAVDGEQTQLTSAANLLNDGILRKYFIHSGLLMALATPFSSDIKEELWDCVSKEQMQMPLAYSKAIPVDANVLWGYFAPQLKQEAQTLVSLTADQVKDSIAVQMSLYQGQELFPPSFVHQILKMQIGQAQADQLPPIRQCLLFGHKNFEDWFGPKMLRLCTEFVINGALIAKERGFKISDSEALLDLQARADFLLKQYQVQVKNQKLDRDNFIRQQAAGLGLNVSQMAHLWKEVLLFKSLLEGASTTALQDLWSLNKLQEHSGVKLQGIQYAQPSYVKLEQLQDLEEFETYLFAVGQNWQHPEHPLLLPEGKRPVEEVAREWPQLVGQKYTLAVARVSCEELYSKNSLMQVWAWLDDDAHWQQIASKFKLQEDILPETRLDLFESLTVTVKGKVDRFIRDQLVRENAAWIEEALDVASVKNHVITLRLQGGALPFEGMQDRQDLIAKLKAAPFGEDVEVSPDLLSYTQDGHHFYRIKVLDKESDLDILPYQEVKNDGTLASIVEERLYRYWPEAISADPLTFLDNKAERLPFENVKDKVFMQMYAQPVAALKSLLQKNGISLQDLKNDNWVAQLRYYPVLANVKEKIADHEKFSEESQDLDWQVRAIPITYSRKNHPFGAVSDLSTLTQGQLSNIVVEKSKFPYFCSLQEVQQESKDLVELVQKEHNALAMEAQTFLMTSLLEQCIAKNAMTLTTD